MHIKIIPAAMRIMPSRRDRMPFSPNIIGSMQSAPRYRSFLMILLWTRNGWAASVTRPRMRVRSAMFPPRSVPSPMLGFPSSADSTLMIVSGSDETTAMTMKLVVNSVSLSHRARCDTDLIAYSALLTSTMQPMMNMSTSSYM